VRARDTHKGSYGGVSVIGGARGPRRRAARRARRAGERIRQGVRRVAWRTGVRRGTSRTDDPRARSGARRRRRPVPSVADWDVRAGATRARRGAALALPAVVDRGRVEPRRGGAALARALRARTAPAVLTPHPLERLVFSGGGRDVRRPHRRRAGTREDRSRRPLSSRGRNRGRRPDGSWAIVDSGSAALATGGTGDVLAGCIATLLSQGRDRDDRRALGACCTGAPATSGSGPMRGDRTVRRPAPRTHHE